VDLGTTLNYWPDPSDTPDDHPVFPPGLDTFGLPTRAEVTARYAERSGRTVDDVRWYEAFACWKTGVVLQQLTARYRRGESTDDRMATKADGVGAQARRAARLLG
jgi:aminoglycoside phosphotransferase (APT) family kinase protein